MSLAAVKSAFSERGRSVFLRYLAVTAVANLVWETVQIPLYTIWRTGSPGEIAFAIVHCTAGDVLITGAALLLALLLAGRSAWPRSRDLRVISAATMLGIAYTVFSEWLNVSVRGSWTYDAMMPVVPPLGTGLTPLLQWVIIPALAYMMALRTLIQTPYSLEGKRRNG